jgi:hypothetical protein
MRSVLLALFLAFFSLPILAEDWTTTDGMSYQDVKVIRVEDDAVTIIYKDGGALIPLFKLPPKLQDRFNYDPAKAKTAAEARSKADAENAKALQAEIELTDRMKKEQAIKDAAARGQSSTTSQ